MWTVVCSAVLLFAVVGARPQDAVPDVQAAPVSDSVQPTVEILSQNEIVRDDGSFNYSYELSNGVKVGESGFIKPGPVQDQPAAAHPDGDEDTDDIQVVEGYFQYMAPNGKLISVRYRADENGFQPLGEHIPNIPEVQGRAQSASSDLEARSGRAELEPQSKPAPAPVLPPASLAKPAPVLPPASLAKPAPAAEEPAPAPPAEEAAPAAPAEPAVADESPAAPQPETPAEPAAAEPAPPAEPAAPAEEAPKEESQ